MHCFAPQPNAEDKSSIPRSDTHNLKRRICALSMSGLFLPLRPSLLEQPPTFRSFPLASSSCSEVFRTQRRQNALSSSYIYRCISRLVC